MENTEIENQHPFHFVIVIYIYYYCIDCTKDNCLCENGDDCTGCKDGYLSLIAETTFPNDSLNELTCENKCPPLSGYYEENGECSKL